MINFATNVENTFVKADFYGAPTSSLHIHIFSLTNVIFHEIFQSIQQYFFLKKEF